MRLMLNVSHRNRRKRRCKEGIQHSALSTHRFGGTPNRNMGAPSVEISHPWVCEQTRHGCPHAWISPRRNPWGEKSVGGRQPTPQRGPPFGSRLLIAEC